MAIDATRGLPSFSDMYEAFKNRGNIGQALQAGVQGYNEAKNASSKRALESSEAQKNAAEAAYNNAHAKMALQNAGVIRLDQITDPAEKASLSQYATPNAEGVLIVPLSTYNAVTHKDQNQQALDLKAQLNDTIAKHNAEIASKDQAINEIQQQKAALAAQLGPKAQAISATKALADNAGQVESPTLLQRGVSMIKEKMGGAPLTSVLAERQAEAARAKLAALGGADTTDNNAPPTPTPVSAPAMSTPAPQQSNPVDDAVGIQPTPSFKTEAELDAAMAQGKIKPGDRVMVGGQSGTAQAAQ